jgi:CDI immunity proteins
MMTRARKILKKSLLELERDYPGEVLPQEKLPLLPLERKLVSVPITELSIDQMCFLIMHTLGQEFLVPAALDKLTGNPFMEGEKMGYSLLGAVLGVNVNFWRQNPDLYRKVEEILRIAESENGTEAETILCQILPQAIYDFRKNKPLDA